MDKKDISIKFISNLEQMPQEEIMETLTREAVAEGISCINWEEYPYAPEVSVRVRILLEHRGIPPSLCMKCPLQLPHVSKFP